MPGGPNLPAYGSIFEIYRRATEEEERRRKQQRRSDVVRSIAAGLRAFGAGAAQSGNVWGGLAMGARGGLEGYMGIQDARERERVLMEKQAFEEAERQKEEAEELAKAKRDQVKYDLEMELLRGKVADSKLPPKAEKPDRIHNPTLGVMMRYDPTTQTWVDETPESYREAAKKRREEDLARWANEGRFSDPEDEDDDETPKLKEIAARAKYILDVQGTKYADREDSQGNLIESYDRDEMRLRAENLAAREMGAPIPHPHVPTGMTGFQPTKYDPATGAILSRPADQFGASQGRGRPSAVPTPGPAVPRTPTPLPTPPKIEHVDPAVVESKMRNIFEKLPPTARALTDQFPQLKASVRIAVSQNKNEDEIIRSIMQLLSGGG